MRGVRPATTSAGRSQRGAIAGAKSRAVGLARRQYNRLRSFKHRRARVLPDRSGQNEGEVLMHSWMNSKLDSRKDGKQVKIAYVQVRDMIERKLAHQKRGVLNFTECKEIASELKDDRNVKALDSVVIENEIRRFAERMEKYDTEPVGSMTEAREDGRVRVMFCQLNGAATKAVRDQKIRGMNYLAKKYDVGIRMFNEHGCNMDNAERGQDFANWIQIGEENRCIVSFNKNDDCCKTLYQPGGTGIYVSGEMVQYVKKMKSDPRGLGRWSSCLMYSHPNHKCRLVTAYNLPDSKPEGLMTNYRQIKRFCHGKGIDMEPRAMFYKDFAKQCRHWKKNGETVGIIMDANEHALNGELTKIMESEGIEMLEISHKFWGETPPNSHVDGSDPITAFYGTNNLEITQLLQLPHISSIGDHKTWIVEITTRSMMGCNLLKIQRTVGRRLTLSNYGAVKEFIRLAKKGCEDHDIAGRMKDCLKLVTEMGTPIPKWLRKKIRLVHDDFDRVRLHAERNCRKLYTPESPYSPVIQAWYDRIHAYIALFRVLENPGNRNVDHAYRFAKRHGIQEPKNLTMEEIRDGLTYCKQQQRAERLKAHPVREDHLLDCLRNAIRRKKKKAAARIKQIISGERSRKNWRSIKYVLGKPRNPPVTSISRVEDGSKVHYDTEDGVKTVFREECRERYTSARKAPIMNTDLGCLGTIDENNIYELESLSKGELDIPDDLDDASRALLEEIITMGKDMEAVSEDSPDMTSRDFSTFWNGVSEHTQSSQSGLHYGVYKAAAKDEFLSDIHASHMTMIARSGVYPLRWTKSMQILSQKRAGEEVDMTNLRYLQLFDADFNRFKQHWIGKIAMGRLTESGLLPEEHGSRRGSTSTDSNLDVTLSLDVSRQARIPMAILSLDASQCYDRVNHILMGLIWIVLTRNPMVVLVILSCLQVMEFIQRTGYGDSDDSFGIINCLITWMGLGQGSRGAAHGWMQLSTVIVNVMKKTGHVSDMVNPITKEKINSVGSLFVDDANLMVWGDRKQYNNVKKLYVKVKATSRAWACLLIATGGALKPAKCFWWLIGYVNIKGRWFYERTKGTPLEVLGDDREVIEVLSLGTKEEKKSLGMFVCPEGGSMEQLELIKEKVKGWVGKMNNGHLPPNLAWMAYTHKLWPSVRYSIGTMTNDVEDADTLLDDEEYNSLNIFGVASTLTKGLRKLHSTFGGLGLFRLKTEQFIERTLLLLQHYRTGSVISKKMDASLAYLQLQLGTNVCPFDLDYDKWNKFAPLSWTKMLWRTMDVSGFSFHLAYDELELPRMGDQNVADMFMSYTNDEDTLMALQRVRASLNVLFLSDVVTADGKSLEHSIVDPDSWENVSSKYDFPLECPTDEDILVWLDFWMNHCQENYRLPTPLGKWREPTHREWEWFYDKNRDVLQHKTEDGIIDYVRTASSRGRCWTAGQTANEVSGNPASVKSTENGDVKLRCHGPGLVEPKEIHYESVWDLIESWGADWMWDSMKKEDREQDLSWVKEGMINGTLVWCCDGSYKKKVAPTASGAGWMVYCTKTGNSLKGCFYEISEDAGSYRGEQLGMCAVHHLIAAFSLFFAIMKWRTKVCCDNEGTIKMSRRRLVRVRSKMGCADILRNIRTSRKGTDVAINYFHVEGHMDRYLSDEELTLEQWMNKQCDILAKFAIDRWIRQGLPHPGLQLLPREDAAFIVDGIKVTGDIGEAIRFAEGMEEAREFFVGREKWSHEKFDEVDWKILNNTLNGKNKGFKIWLMKQHSGFCGTRVQVGYYSGEGDPDVKCPNCGEREDAAHLCCCPDEDRTRLICEYSDDLESWMHKGGKTHYEIAYWIPKWIKCRGVRRLQDMGPMSGEMKMLAKSQDLIGFRHFMEGRISKVFWEMQSRHLALSPGHLNGTEWTKHFITRVLKITQSQWIYRNVSFHDKQHGYAKTKRVEELNHSIRQLSTTDPRALPKDCKFLLERDDNDLSTESVLKKEYWVKTMQAAIKAGRRFARRGKRARRTAEKVRKNTKRNERLGVFEVEREIRGDMERPGQIQVRFSDRVKRGDGKRGATAMWLMGSNKRYKPGD